jgi:hypothetical protein
MRLIQFDDAAMEAGNYVRIGEQSHGGRFLTAVRQFVENVTYAFQPRYSLVIGFHDDPGTEGRVRFIEHQFFKPRVSVIGPRVPGLAGRWGSTSTVLADWSCADQTA